MASSSKRSRAASTKKSSSGKARRISLRRTDVLPRTGVAAEARAKPVAGSKKKAQRPGQTEAAASRTKARRPAGRASAKPKRPAAKAITRMAPAPDPMAVEPQPVAETVGAAPLETEIVVEASAILEETTIATAFAPPPISGRRALVGVISRLLSTLRRWTMARE